ncbi:septation protein IspZ [Rhodobacteraceae bacterium XHP0102]|nr:septation protein IspZ [Rhodobacteraceae bacterium XHP0102]
MTKGKPIAPWLKTALELGPVLGFFVLYLWIKDQTFTIAGVEYSGFIMATALFIPVIGAAIAALWYLTGHISRMQVFTLFMVVFFGGLTIWFNDERFFKMKTTIVYAVFAALLGIGLLRGQSWLKLLMGEFLKMRDEGWMIITRRLAATFAVMAVANEIVWRNFSEQFWVTFETFALPAFLFAAFMAQAKVIERFTVPSDEA